MKGKPLKHFYSQSLKYTQSNRNPRFLEKNINIYIVKPERDEYLNAVFSSFDDFIPVSHFLICPPPPHTHTPLPLSYTDHQKAVFLLHRFSFQTEARYLYYGESLSRGEYVRSHCIHITVRVFREENMSEATVFILR